LKESAEKNYMGLREKKKEVKKVKINLTSFHMEMWVSGGTAPLFLRLCIRRVSFTLRPPYSSTNWTVGYVGTRTGLDTAVANISLLFLLGNQTSIIQHSLMTLMTELSQLQGESKLHKKDIHAISWW
jgi:hypothetical protein